MVGDIIANSLLGTKIWLLSRENIILELKFRLGYTAYKFIRVQCLNKKILHLFAKYI